MKFVIPDDEVSAAHALALRVFVSSNVDPGPREILTLESEHHLYLEAVICLHWTGQRRYIRGYYHAHNETSAPSLNVLRQQNQHETKEIKLKLKNGLSCFHLLEMNNATSVQQYILQWIIHLLKLL